MWRKGKFFFEKYKFKILVQEELENLNMPEIIVEMVMCP